MSNLTVGDVYGIDVDDLTFRADDSDYWADCLAFYLKVETDPVETLSTKQIEWLENIQTALEADSNIT